MGVKFVNQLGLKATCGHCEEKFTLNDGQQRQLFYLNAFPCPKCRSMLLITEQARDELLSKGNPGQHYVELMGIGGVLGALFFGLVLLGSIDSEPLILTMIVAVIGFQLWISSAYHGAVHDLHVALSTTAPVEDASDNRA